ALAPHAPSTAAAAAIRIRRRLSSRAPTSVRLVPPEKGKANPLEPRVLPVIITPSDLPAVLLTPPRRFDRRRYLRPLVAGIAVGLLSFLTTLMFNGRSERSGELLTSAKARVAAVAQGLLGK